MSFLPGTSRNNQYGDTRIPEHEAEIVRKLVVWNARTDADEKNLLEHLGLAQ